MQKQTILRTASLYVDWIQFVTENHNKYINISGPHEEFLQITGNGKLIRIIGNESFSQLLSLNIDTACGIHYSLTARYTFLVCIWSNRYAEKCQRYAMLPNMAISLTVYFIHVFFEGDY